MAAVTLLGTATFNTTSGTKTVTATPAVGDLIVIVTAHSGNTSTAAPTDNNSSGTYTLVNTAVKATSADTMKVWVRNSLITSATSTVFTHAPGTSTGGGLAVLKITGMSLSGSSAIVRSGIQSNIASGTPAPALGATPGVANAIITAVFNATSPAGVTQRTGYTRSVNLGYATPTTGLAVAHDDAGETSGTITWGGTSATAFASIAVEIDARVTHGTTGTLTGQIGSVDGAADHEAAAVPHTTSGDLVGPGASVVGAAARFRAHDTDGTLDGQTATITGAADRESASIPHVTTGTLTGQGSTLEGSAARTRQHATDGALSGGTATITGDADHEAQSASHVSSGDLTGQGSTLSGTAFVSHLHATSGDLVGPGAEIIGDADRSDPEPPEPPSERGDGVDARWTKKQRRERDRKLAEERDRKDELRQLLKRALDPVTEEAAVEVVTVDDGVVVIPAAGKPVAVPRPDGIDLRAMSREIGKILSDAKVQAERTRRAQSQEIARVALEQARENVRRLIRKRRQEEFLLLMT